MYIVMFSNERSWEISFSKFNNFQTVAVNANCESKFPN